MLRSKLSVDMPMSGLSSALNSQSNKSHHDVSSENSLAVAQPQFDAGMRRVSIVALSLLSLSMLSAPMSLAEASNGYRMAYEQHLYNIDLAERSRSNALEYYTRNPMQLMRDLNHINSMRDATKPADAISEALEDLQSQSHLSNL